MVANLDNLTKRINVLVKTNNRLALEFQKALAKTPSERNAVEQMIYRISRDVDEVTDEIVMDEDYYGVKKVKEAVREAESEALLQIERERIEARERIAQLERATEERIAQQKEISSRELEALKREVEAFQESSKSFTAATEAHTREIEAIAEAVEFKISSINEISDFEKDLILKSRRARNWIIFTLSLLLPGFYFLGDYIDLLEILM